MAAGFWDETTELSAPNLNRTTVPAGGIIMFSGSLGDLPDGWVLCDGSNGTPDLRDRFVVGAHGGYSQGATGGQDAVTLTEAQMPEHSHDVRRNGHEDVDHHHNRFGDHIAGRDVTFEATEVYDDSDPIGATGGGLPHENRPPYYALAFIMRVA